MNHRRLLIIGILIYGVSNTAGAGNPPEPSRRVEHLGTVHFANSCSPDVQTDINRGVAMLHSFQYGFTEKTFLHVLERDSQCAIAYWGAAINPPANVPLGWTAGVSIGPEQPDPQTDR